MIRMFNIVNNPYRWYK